MNVYNMIIARTFFSTAIPSSLYEAAELDGCSHFKYFLYSTATFESNNISHCIILFCMG